MALILNLKDVESMAEDFSRQHEEAILLGECRAAGMGCAAIAEAVADELRKVGVMPDRWALRLKYSDLETAKVHQGGGGSEIGRRNLPLSATNVPQT